METDRLFNIKATLFVIAMMLLTIQTVNLGYLNWFTEKPPRQERTEEEEASEVSKAVETAYENRNISEMNYFCLSGLILVICGVVVSKRLNALIGLSLVIAGFCDLIGYSGVLIRHPNTDYNRFMTLKFVYSGASLLLLLIVAHMIDIIRYYSDMTEEIQE